MRTCRWALLGLLAVALLGLACGDPISTRGDGGGAGPAGGAGQRRQDSPATSGRDGSFAFTVNRMTCGHTSLGEERLSQEADGMFCVIELMVENIGHAPQAVELSAQKAFDAKGNVYDAVDSFAIRTINSERWRRPIPPGERATGRLVYDVPRGTELVRLQLHDSDFSNGVDVAIP